LQLGIATAKIKLSERETIDMAKIKIIKIKEREKIKYELSPEEMSKAIEEANRFLRWRSNSKLSPNTVEADARCLSFYYDFMEERGLTCRDVTEMSKDEQNNHFVKFLNWLLDGNHSERHKSIRPSTCNRYLGKVFGFYGYLIERGYKPLKVLVTGHFSLKTNVGTTVGITYTTFPGYLLEELELDDDDTISVDDLREVLMHCRSDRDRAIVLLLADTGIRISELLGIRICDIDYAHRRIYIRLREDNPNESRAKNDERRWVSYCKETEKYLYRYIYANESLLKKSEMLFLILKGKTRGTAMDRRAAVSVFQNLEIRSNIPITPHRIRHLVADVLFEQGYSIVDIADVLGHRQIETTKRYITVSTSRKRDAIATLHAVNEENYGGIAA